MLLVAAMVLTVAPVSGYSALADQGYEYSTPTLNPITFTVDTSETTEVTRVAAGRYSFSLPNGTDEAPYTIVEATPSGVPKAHHSSDPASDYWGQDSWGKIAYAGEIPESPKVVFKITGATTEAPAISANIGGIAFASPTKKTSGDTTTYTWTVSSGNNGLDSGAGTDIVYTLSYKVNSVPYVSYAYSHVENIIVMNGFVSSRKVDVDDSDEKYFARQAVVGQYQSHNMYTRMNGADLVVSTGTETDPNAKKASNREVGYINYAAAGSTTGGALKGCGSEKDLNGDADAYGSIAPNGAIPGDEQPALIKAYSTDKQTTFNLCHHNDTNRGEPVIYLDAGDGDTLESLNFRFTAQAADTGDFGVHTFADFRFVMPGANDLANDCAISDEIYHQTGTKVPENQISTLGNNYGSSGSNTITEPHTGYFMAKFGGLGPAANASLEDNYTVFASWYTAGTNNKSIQTTAGMNLIFRRYDTTDLRALYNGILAGTGSYSFRVTSGLTGSVTFNRGKMPNNIDAASAEELGNKMYTINSVDRNGSSYPAGQTDWTMFVTALNNAGKIIARPDNNQTVIDNATKALHEAYLNLEGYYDQYYVEIWHCRTGTQGTEADIIRAKDGTVLKQLVNNGNPVASGQIIGTAAATITGYKVVGKSIKNETISGAVNGETGTNKLIIRYYYEPEDVQIEVLPNNPNIDPYMKTVKYGSTVDLTAKDENGELIFKYGEKVNYTFAGWLNSMDNQVYDVLSANGNKTFTMPESNVTLIGQWKITPLKVIGIPVTNKGVVFEGKQLGDDIILPDEVSSVQFAEPTKYVESVAADGTKTYKDGRYLNDGYLFGGYYESYDAETQTFGNPVSWPFTFEFGQTDRTVYIRWVDVKGTVSFETNGGSAINDITYSTTPAEIVAPANPTKLGYDFVQWHDTENFVPGEGADSPTAIKADDGTVWTAGKVKTQQTQTGFLAYAEWAAQTHSITFNMGASTSDFDTTTAQMPILRGLSDSPVDPDDIPPAPTKYGKTFAQWVIQGTNTVYNFDVYPKQDIVLVPVWNDTKYSAFVSIGAYEKLATGETTLVAPTSTEPGSAQAGDVVTFRMTSLTNFYNGSTVFVFMYDKNFYELVAEGTDAFVLNSENEYVAGIEASAYGVTNDTTLGKLWPAELTTEPNNIRADYNAMMVTIDPTVSSGNFNCEPMSDGKWLIEFQLRVKDTATEGDSGKVYMSNDWTRTADNIMGTMFYGWAETGEVSVADTYNNRVTPNLDKATATIQIDPTPALDRTVNLLPYGGVWADGSDEKLTYTGREATEILDFTAPTREGYTIEKDETTGKNIWYKYDEATETVDKTVTWTEGYYATEEIDGLTFVPSWKGVPCTVNYYEEEGAELWDSEEVPYGEPINGPFYDVEKKGYVFDGWKDAEGNIYKEGETTVPLGGVDLYAIWKPGTASYSIVIHYFDKQSNADKTVTRSGEATTESRVELVETAPGTTEGITYVLWSSLPTIRGYEFDSSDSRNEFVIERVDGEGTSVINVYYIAATITYTFDATEGGTFPTSGERYATSTGKYYDAFSISTIETPVKDGYVFKAWTPNAANVTTYNQDRTYTATWDVRKVSAIFNAGDGNFGTGTDGAEIKTTTVEYNYDTSITKPANNPVREGYNFLGWAATPDGEPITDATLGTATDYENGHTYYAKWQKASYGVTYFVDGIVSGEVETVEYEGTVTVRAFPEDIEGYTFKGWTYDGKTYAPGDTFSMPAGAVDLKGKFVADEFDAVFDATGGYFGSNETATTATVKVFYDANGTSPAKPTRSGYEFLGYTDTEGSTTIVLNANASFTMDAEGKTYYAVWKATFADYTIEYYEMAVDGTYPATATSSTTRTGNVEGTVSAPVNVPNGFSLDEESEVTPEKSILSGTVTPAPNNLVLKVYYSRNQYTVYTTVDGTRTVAGTFYYGADVAIADPPAKEGHTVAWSPAVTTPMEAQDQELTAAYNPINYTVTFYEAKDSTKILQQTNNQYGMNMSAPAATMVGYTLDKWVDAETGTAYTSEEIADLKTPSKAVNFYATWTLNSNTVNFRANGGLYADNSNNKAITVDYNKEVVAPEIPTRAGYTFTGWQDNATKIVYVKDTALPAMIDGLVNYVAQWSQETYTVSWISDGKEVTGEEFATSAVYGDEFTSPEMEKRGYTFNGWSYNGTTYPAGETIIIADAGDNGAAITITADWSANEYVATFDANGGAWADGDKSKNVPTFFDAKIIAPADPVRAGYTFNGWEPEVGNMTEENMTFTADWLANGGITYTVITYTMGTDGQYGEGVSKAYEGVTDATVNVKPATVAEGFKLNDSKSTYEGTVTADGKLTLEVYIDRETYQFNTSVTNGTTTDKVGYLFGQTVVVPAEEVKEGWTFDGWYDGATKYAAGNTFEMPARDVTLTGTLTINKYDVIYYVDGVEYDRIEDVEFGTPVTVLESLNKVGYTFSGWDKADFTMPDEEVKIYGTWTAVNYTVTWVDGIDTTEDKVDTYIYENIIIAPADPVKAGYTFKGWMSDSGEMFAEGATMPAANVIYTAQWQANSGVAYTVETYKMKSDGTTYDKTVETLYGTTDETAVYAVKDYEGFTFQSGTNYNADANTISGTINGNGTTVLEVRYSRNKVIVNVNGEEDEYFYEDVIEEPTPKPVDPNGGEFDGWEDEDGKPVDFPYTVPDEEDGEITITPVYNYTVKFISEGEEIFSIKDRAETEYTVPNASKVGYTFTGWTLDGEDAGITAESTAKIPVGGATYVAAFEGNDGIVYKVETYKMATDGVTYEKVDTEEFNGKAGSTATYAVKDYEGFTFVSGTNYDADADTISGTIKGDGTTVLEVRYSRNKITVIINGDKDDYYYDEKIEDPTPPTEPEGMDHTGWVDEDGNPVEFPYNVPTDENDEIIITPVFTPINYVVTFISDGATVEEKEVPYGSKITAPADPVKTGFRFMGWADEKGEYLTDETKMPANAVTYTAVFEITTVGVTYYVDGQAVGAVSSEYGQVISTTVPGYIVPTGYSISAWYTDADCTVPFVEGTTYGSGVTKLYAKTTANEYKAVFNANGGKFADGTDTYEVMVAFDSEITPPAAPEREGFDFVGWDPMVGTMDEEGMTFTAVWADTVDFYTITYYVDYVDETTEPYEVFSVTVGEDFEVPAEPDKAGWKFLGWSADPNATAGDTLPEKMPAENLVYYAIFERSAATVTFYDYAATEATPWKTDVAEKASEADVNFGDTIEFPANNSEISEKYWIFLGWSTTEGGEVIADTSNIVMGEDVATEYYAVYKKVAVKLVPKAGSTTMIERNGAIESYNEGYTVTDEFVATTDSTKNLIYGLRVNQRDTVLLTTYVEVLGDGYAVVTPVVRGRLGTGTKVEVYDNADTSAPVETLYVVIFGDIDGNARLTADDSSAVDKEILDPSWSSNRTKVEYLFRAANLDGNRRLTSDDGVLLDSVILGASLDQVTGKVS